MDLKKFGLLIFFAILFMGTSVLCQEKTYVSRRLDNKPPVIDGLDNDSAWKGVDWGENFTQRVPFEGKPPSQATSFKITYDDNNIYVLVRAYDNEPDSIVRRLTRKDEFDGDYVSVMFDSYEDKMTGFSFSVTAAGVKIDEAITNDVNWDVTWDAVWYVKVKKDDQGWLAEMRIPLSQLRFSKKDEYHWGLQVMRMIFRKNETSVWKPMPREKSQWVRLFGTMDGLKGIKPRRDIEIVPYAVTKAKSYQEEKENPYSKGKEVLLSAGVDGKIGITNDLTLNFSVNPDFGQVEADPSEVNLTAFETYFSEKRPFFIEGKNIFSFQVTDGDGGLSADNLFYSRRIGRNPQYEPEIPNDKYIKKPEETNILGAFKLSGKTRTGWSIGILESFTQKETAKIGNNNESQAITAEPFTNYFIARTTKDFNKGQQILGGMFTATNRDIKDKCLAFLTDAAYSGGINYAAYTKNHNWEFIARSVFSQVSGSTEAITRLQEAPTHNFQRVDNTNKDVDTTLKSLSGQGGTFSLSKIGGGRWRFSTWVSWRSPGLELNDVGYLHNADEVQQISWIQYQILEPFSVFRLLSINVNQWIGFDYYGNKTYDGVNTNLWAEFKNSWSGGFGVNRDGESYTRSVLRGGPIFTFPGGWQYWVEIISDSRKKVMFDFNHSAYYGDHNHFITNTYNINMSIRPCNAISIQIAPEYTYSRDKLQYVTTEPNKGNTRYILAGLDQHIMSASIRFNVNLSPDMTIQYWGQPFLFAGDFKDFKYAADSKSDEFYARFHKYSSQEIQFDNENNTYDIDDNIDGKTDYTIENPDFNFFQFRSNLVFRWEFIPGSTIFLVWSQGRTGSNELGNFNFKRGINDLYSVYPEDVALLKVSYRFVF